MLTMHVCLSDSYNILWYELVNYTCMCTVLPPPRFKLRFYHYSSENVTIEVEFNKTVNIPLNNNNNIIIIAVTIPI